MGDNLRIRNFRDNLIKLINEEPLPIELKRIIVNDISVELNQVADKQLEQERKNISKEESEVKE